MRNIDPRLKIKTAEEIEKMRKLGKVIADILEETSDFAVAGKTFIEIDKYAEDLCKKNKVNPSCKGYGGFPNTICIGKNDQAVHGIPNNTEIEDGDIVTIDLVIDRDGWFVDHALTKAIGEVDNQSTKLLEATQEARSKAIELSLIGNTIGDLGFMMENVALKHGFNVLKNMVGHGIGRHMHEYPQVPCFGDPGEGLQLIEGMVYTIEPMLTQKSSDIIVDEDGWTTRTEDGGRFAIFEHTIAVTADGPEILTTK